MFKRAASRDPELQVGEFWLQESSTLDQVFETLAQPQPSRRKDIRRNVWINLTWNESCCIYAIPHHLYLLRLNSILTQLTGYTGGRCSDRGRVLEELLLQSKAHGTL